jgi:hypothetical protein
MSRQASRFYAFGPFRLDPSERVLLSNGERILLTPKALDTLLVLVERNGHVLGKDELLKIVWPDTFVEEGTLAQNISTIRKALGESGFPFGYWWTRIQLFHRRCEIHIERRKNNSLLLDEIPNIDILFRCRWTSDSLGLRLTNRVCRLIQR